MIPPKRFDIFSPLTGGCLEALDAFRFLLKSIRLEKEGKKGGEEKR